MPRWVLVAAVVAVAVAVAPVVLLGVLLPRVSGGPSHLDALRPALWAAGVLAAVLVLGMMQVRIRRVTARLATTRWWAAVGQFAGAIAYVLLLMGVGWFRGGSALVAVATQLPMVTVFAGLGVLSGVVARVGEELHCAKCDYEMDAETAETDNAMSRCPECGAYWKRRLGTVKGRRVLRPRRAVIGGGIVAIGVGLAVVVGVSRNAQVYILRALPTSSLITEVSSPGAGFTIGEWAALSARTLTPRQEERLAEGLLKYREARQHLSREAEGWLESRVLSGALPESIRERYFRGMLTLWVDAPGRARVGEDVSVGISSDYRGTVYTPTTTTLTVCVLFGGFQVGDGEPEARATNADHALLYGRVARDRGKSTPTGYAGPQITVRAEAAGATKVLAEYWLVVGVAGPPAITWGADGQPALPPGTVWAERVVIEAEVRVEP